MQFHFGSISNCSGTTKSQSTAARQRDSTAKRRKRVRLEESWVLWAAVERRQVRLRARAAALSQAGAGDDCGGRPRSAMKTRFSTVDLRAVLAELNARCCTAGAGRRWERDPRPRPPAPSLWTRRGPGGRARDVRPWPPARRPRAAGSRRVGLRRGAGGRRLVRREPPGGRRDGRGVIAPRSPDARPGVWDPPRPGETGRRRCSCRWHVWPERGVLCFLSLSCVSFVLFPSASFTVFSFVIN